MARILIVDDAAIMRKNLRAILTQAGHTVVAEASNGSQAYTEYQKHSSDLVTLDITMPFINGIDILKKIIEDSPDAKILIISSVNNNRVILEALQYGAKNYIIKPFTVEKLLDVVNQVLKLQEEADKETIEGIYANPYPLPDNSLTSSLVENSSQNIRSSRSSSFNDAAAISSCFSNAAVLFLISSRSIPLPSSAIDRQIYPLHFSIWQPTDPNSFFSLAARSKGSSMP